MPFLTLSNDPEKRRRQVERGQAIDRENERRMNAQELFDAINTIRAQENTVVRHKPESRGDIPRYASPRSEPRSEPRHEMREAPLPSYTDTLGALKYNLSPTLGVAQLAALPALVYDLGETAVDALRGTNSPSRFRQVANALSKGMGGPSMPNTAAEWRGELAGNLLNPANFVSAVGSPLRMLRAVPAALRHGAEGFAQAVPVSNVVKNKGGNWLTGSVEGALGGLKRSRGLSVGDLEAELAGYRPGTPSAQRVEQELAPARQNAALNSFIDKQLTRYVKNEMATPEDPIRALAERGVLHFEPPTRGNTVAAGARKMAGYPLLSEATTEQARRWEDLVDAIPSLASYKGHVPFSSALQEDALRQLGGEFAVKNPEALAYSWNRGRTPADLGFPHLIDELSNALNPESGLPRHLLLDPKSMDRVSVPQAVERVAAINAWRAAQKAEADMLRANNAATQIYKEYAENNPLGLRWVELKVPDDVSVPEFTRADQSFTQRGLRIGDQYYEVPYGKGATHESVARDVARRQALQDALKYEGDTMGHCVGGYCNDVASGRSRIYSLRDTKGQPHVTIEVAPGGKMQIPQGDIAEEAMLRARQELGDEADYEDVVALGESLVPSIEKEQRFSGSRIVQIKGKQNRAPNEEYLPFVQDFVRSGKWSDVGDLQNTGLRRITEPKLRETLGDFVTEEEWAKHMGGFSSGGSVGKDSLSVEQLRAIISTLRQEHLNAA